MSFLIVAGAIAFAGIVGVLTNSGSTPSSIAKKEVPDRPSRRSPASNQEEGSSSQPSALSIRPTANVLKGLNITESQIQKMEAYLPELQKDVSLFKDTQGWVVRFHHSSKIMSGLGVKDGDLISFKHLQDMKNEPALKALVGRLESVLSQLQK